MVSYEAHLAESKSNRYEVRIFSVIFFFLSLLLSPASVFAGGNPSTQLHIPIAASNLLGNGDYISNAGGLDTYYSYFIEVPPGLSTLNVDIFDADIGLGGANDLQYGAAWDTTASYTLFDPDGLRRPTLFTTGGATNPAGANNAWLNFFTSGSGTGNFVRDNFGTAAYNNNDGNNIWATNWVETDTGGGGATLGNIRITGGELRFTGATNNNIYRQVDLSGTGLNLASAVLSFSYSTSGNLENDDCVRIDVSGNGGTSYTTLQTFCNDSSGTVTYNITSSIASNTRIRFYISNALEGGGGAEYFYVDNVQIGDNGGPPTPGHWEVRVDMSGSAGDDYNGFAVRAHDGNSGAGGTELNMYAKSFIELGVIGAATLAETMYPYITSGCTFDSNDFDSDGGTTSTSINFTSRAGDFTTNIPNASLSGNAAWANNPVPGWTNDVGAYNYGIWSMQANVNSVTAGNMISYYIGDFAAANPPPAAQPQSNTFRMYLPTDAGAAPVKPFLTQTLAWSSGPNPPAVGSATRVQIDINVFNPTPWPITFSASNVVTANVPGGQILYAGSANTTVSQGSVTAEPGAGGSGNITWNPGTVAAGTTVKLTYQVDVTPTALGRILVTGTPATNGTTARYVDETGNTTQAAATYTFGPLCELAATAGGSPLPTLAVISSFRGYEANGQAVVEWSTSSEVDTAGFYLYRLDESKSRFKIINNDILPALLTAPEGGTYSLIDKGASPEKSNTYLLVEMERKGRKNSYGPFTVQMNGVSVIGNRKGAGTLSTAAQGLFSGYSRRAHALSAEKKKRIKIRKTALEKAGIQTMMRKGETAKISIDKQGLYFIDSQEISSLFGISLNSVRDLIETGRLAISSQGSEVAYMPSSDASGIFFYGQGVDSIYTKKNIYWLYKGRGLQMEQVDGNGPSPAGDETFTRTKHIEEDRFAVTNAIQDPESDYWFWDYVYAITGSGLEKRTFSITADGVADLSTDGGLTVNLQGFTAAEHQVIVRLNGNVLVPNVPDSDQWTGTGPQALGYTFSKELLYEGDNTIEVEGVPAAGALPSIFFVDSFDIIYQRLYQAAGNSLLLQGDGNNTVTAYGFTSPDILVFDISDPYRPKLHSATTFSGAAGNYSVSFAPLSPETPYLASTADAAGTRVKAWADSPSTLSSRENLADYIVITTDELADAARSYAGYWQSRGLQTMVVMVEDIMDEFNYGISSPKALHDFLSHAFRKWGRHPKYVLLAGEGTYDYRDNLGHGDNLVPVKMLATAHGLAPSDNYFADVDGDHIPDMAIGRLPVATDMELNNMLNKLISYDPGTTREMLWVADGPDDAGNFPADSDEIAKLIPPEYPLKKIYLSDYPLDSARQLLFEGINNGVLFLNYTGHAAVDRFSGQGLLTTSDVNSLMNTGKLPVVTALTCVVGQFAFPGYDSLSEALVTKQDGGAIAFLGPTGMALNSSSKELANMFFETIFTDGVRVLGKAVRKAFEKYNAMYGGSYVLDIYNLQGDPALRIK